MRCVKCSHVWHQAPQKSFGSAFADAAPDGPPPAISQPRRALDDEFSRATERRWGASAEAPTRRGSAVSARVGWLALAGAVVVLVAVLGLFAGGIMAAWPATARLYALVGFVDLPRPIPLLIGKDISTSKGKSDDQQPTLSIAGLLSNHTESPQPIPPLRLVLHRADGGVVKTVEFPAEQPTIAPGSSVPFKTTITNPPADAVTADVTFAVN